MKTVKALSGDNLRFKGPTIPMPLLCDVYKKEQTFIFISIFIRGKTLVVNFVELKRQYHRSISVIFGSK